MSERPVVVVGLMASGKTTVAKGVAEALDRPFRDNDEELADRYGASAADLYARHGVEVLHEREAGELSEALASTPPPVIAAAASIVDNPGCRAALAGAYVVWLDAPPEVLASRVGRHDHRPHYDPEPVRMLARQYAQRVARFREVADLTLDVSHRGPQETIEAAVAAIAAATSGE